MNLNKALKVVAPIMIAALILFISGSYQATISQAENSEASSQSSVSYQPPSSSSESSQMQSSSATESSSSQSTQTKQKSSASASAPDKPLPLQPVAAPSGKCIVGYFPSWAYLNNYSPSDVDAAKLTHINYAFASISSDNKLVMNHPKTDIKNFEGLRKLKAKNSALKLLISVGGWDGSKKFSNAALTAQSRETFANSCINFIVTHKLDGIDLDWEYPVSGGFGGIINRPEDKQNFTKLIQAIRQKMQQQTKKDSKKYYLTIAGAPSSGYLKNIELTKILPYLDYIFLMGYDMHGPWDEFADFNAPLYTPQESSPQYSSSINDAVQTYLNAGAAASKLVLGMPFYGYRYEVTNNDNYGLYQTFSNGKSVAYSKIVTDYLDKYDKSEHPQAKVPYLFGNDTFITYDDENSIAMKVQLAKKLGLAGVGAWELSQDSQNTLLSSAYSNLF